MTDFEYLLSRLHEAAGDDATRKRIVSVLRSFEGRRVYIARAAFGDDGRVSAARSMLDAGMVRADIAAALQGRFGVSRSTSYKLIGEALNGD